MSRRLNAVFDTYGAQVLALLAGDHDRSQETVFGSALAMQLHGFAQGAGAAESIRPLMSAFVHQACPADQMNAETVRWICKAYIAHRHNDVPLLAEDLYRLREDISYLHALKNAPVFRQSGKSADLLSYDSYDALRETLRPFYVTRGLREEARRAFHVSPEEMQATQSETTVLYDGPTGKVVVPHTVRASQYWGRNTRWCIAGKGVYTSLDADNYVYAELHFPQYNSRTPVIMLLPKKGGSANKLALVDGKYWDAEDKSSETIGPDHAELWQAMLQTHAPDVQAHLESLKPQAKVTDAVIDQLDFSFAERDDADFMARAISANPSSFSRASSRLIADPQFVIRALELGVDYADVLNASRQVPHIWDDPDVALAAVCVRPQSYAVIKSDARYAPQVALAAALYGQVLPPQAQAALPTADTPDMLAVRRVRAAAVAQARGYIIAAREALRFNPLTWGDADKQFGDVGTCVEAAKQAMQPHQKELYELLKNQPGDGALAGADRLTRRVNMLKS